MKKSLRLHKSINRSQNIFDKVRLFSGEKKKNFYNFIENNMVYSTKVPFLPLWLIKHDKVPYKGSYNEGILIQGL